MKKNRYTEEQIAYALKQAEVGTAVPEICRRLGIAEQTFLPLAQQVCRDAAQRPQTTQAVGGGERQAQEAGG